MFTAFFALASLSAYSMIMKREAIYSSEMLFDFHTTRLWADARVTKGRVFLTGIIRK
jgi:hypothetical protein